MRFSLPLALLAVFFLASCAEEPPPPITQHHRASAYPPTQPQEYPPQQQPLTRTGPFRPKPRRPRWVAPPPPPTPPPRTKGAKEDIRMEFLFPANPISW